ncbi:hypothetical protein B296_00016275 [Ensete ventricosum]|uniref:Polyadenylate-binding protein 2 n=1 Tax=Ensete ventricosum TaxID=4639 RepID=A0A426ZAA4_ENSVE|nr:hypothetical protein B296_00016275 [Ensete ventricosum]
MTSFLKHKICLREGKLRIRGRWRRQKREPRSVGGETMDEEEHEVYGGEIPDEADMDADVDMALPNESAAKVILSPELDEMKRRLKEMEDEAAALREIQAKVEKEMGAVQESSSAVATQAGKEEVDARSVFVGNVAAKRTNVPGMKQFRPRRFSPYAGSPYRRPFMPPYFASPYGYGKAPRFRRPMRYRPYL